MSEETKVVKKPEQILKKEPGAVEPAPEPAKVNIEDQRKAVEQEDQKIRERNMERFEQGYRNLCKATGCFWDVEVKKVKVSPGIFADKVELVIISKK